MQPYFVPIEKVIDGISLIDHDNHDIICTPLLGRCMGRWDAGTLQP
jgi:hypothetical protein